MSSDFNSLKDISFANVFEQYREENLNQYIWHRNQARTAIRSDKTSSLRTARHNANHFANTPMQYTAILQNVHFQMNFLKFFLFLLKTLIVGTR